MMGRRWPFLALAAFVVVVFVAMCEETGEPLGELGRTSLGAARESP